MAEDKKGFLMYADQREQFDQLTDEQAGKLIKHLFAYVNDENPQTNDIVTKISFTPIKSQLKRDLEKYEEKKEQWSKAGKASAEARKKKKKRPSTDATTVNERSKRSTESTVNVNDNDNVSDSVNGTDSDNGTGKVKDSKEERANKFAALVLEFKDKYDLKMIGAFTVHWNESGPTQKKLRHEFEKVFDIAKRLLTWKNNDAKFNRSTSGPQKKNPLNLNEQNYGAR